MVVIRFDSDASDDAIGCTAGNTTSGDDNETTEQPRINITTMDECLQRPYINAITIIIIKHMCSR